jgi:ubiquinone/menaquinone biosynthesis C-methylase UbiE
MTGIDLSDKAIAMAKKNAELQNYNIDYFTADAENLSLFKDETFDGVVSFSTLRYVPDLKKALREICRVTRKGGAVALDFPNRHCPWFTILKNRFGVENHIYDHFYSTKELIALFSEVGFSNIESKKIMFTHYTFPPKFLRFYKFIDAFGEHLFGIKELAAIIVCKGIRD